ncbi:MAG: GYF domain-containing protein, partial [Deltaproteobacteria bacterium]|nr:GYF domain-containing protein [Deltaproteobacteria bacterium]
DAGGEADCPQCVTPVAIPGPPPKPPKPQEKAYFIYKEGRQLGPYPLNQVTHMIAHKQLSATDWAWTDGMSDWQILSMTPGIVLDQWKTTQPTSPTSPSSANEMGNLFPSTEGSQNSSIDALKVSDSWKDIFTLIETAGGYGFSWRHLYWLKNPKALTWRERFRVGFSFWAGIFGPFYYLGKGMWAKALIYTAIIIALLTTLEILTGYAFRFTGSVPFVMLAKWDYYLLKVKKKPLW